MVRERATFGAGCFWGVEETFRRMAGILETQVGYAGGMTNHPTYSQVCGGDTHHAEVVDLIFNVKSINYDDLLNIFWKMHDPTQLNRQGVDVGTQYRSVIFTHSPEQQEKAEKSKALVQAHFQRPIVTQILSASAFWPAEDYHQKYLLKRGKGSCKL